MNDWKESKAARINSINISLERSFIEVLENYLKMFFRRTAAPLCVKDHSIALISSRAWLNCVPDVFCPLNERMYGVADFSWYRARHFVFLSDASRCTKNGAIGEIKWWPAVYVCKVMLAAKVDSLLMRSRLEVERCNVACTLIDGVLYRGALLSPKSNTSWAQKWVVTSLNDECKREWVHFLCTMSVVAKYVLCHIVSRWKSFVTKAAAPCGSVS